MISFGIVSGILVQRQTSSPYLWNAGLFTKRVEVSISVAAIEGDRIQIAVLSTRCRDGSQHRQRRPGMRMFGSPPMVSGLGAIVVAHAGYMRSSNAMARMSTFDGAMGAAALF